MVARIRLIFLAVVALAAIGIYVYYYAPLPFGLAAVIRTPGGGAAANVPPGTTAGAAPATGQALRLGFLSIVGPSVQRNHPVSANNGRGPATTVTLVQLTLQNDGSDSVTVQAGNFQLLDASGRRYAVDDEATRAAAQEVRRRVAFDTTVPPLGRLDTVLAFDAPSDASGLVLRITAGFGDLQLPG